MSKTASIVKQVETAATPAVRHRQSITKIFTENDEVFVEGTFGLNPAGPASVPRLQKVATKAGMHWEYVRAGSILASVWKLSAGVEEYNPLDYL